MLTPSPSSDPKTQVAVLSTIEEAVMWVEQIARSETEEVMALVTGSVHLVGGFLEVLETKNGP